MKTLLLKLISVYKLFLAPIIGGRCRFYPNCSDYARQALGKHTWPRAVFLSINRVLRCSKLSSGGVDLVP